MGHNETPIIKGQEDQVTLSLIASDKEKLVPMQQQVHEGMTQYGSSQQCLPQGQTNIPKGPVKRLFTPKFGKLILERKRSADDAKSKKVF